MLIRSSFSGVITSALARWYFPMAFNSVIIGSSVSRKINHGSEIELFSALSALFVGQ